MPAANGRRVCLAIGVANAQSLDWLPGAASAAADIGEWARCSGFDAVTVLTDQPEIGQSRWCTQDAAPIPIRDPSGTAVTISRIRDELLALLPAGELTHWLVLHFAGHGLRQDSVRTLWLPTDWETENRAVAVEALKTSLEYYGIENITLISDACRDFANRPATANLAPDPVLPRGPVQPIQPGFDRFNAVEDGRPAFMVGNGPGEARCILSGSLANALWGHEPKAFSRHADGQVISDSLLRFISARTKAVGLRYGLDCKAETWRSFGEDNPDMVYFDRDGPPDPRAPPVDWPPPQEAPVQPQGLPPDKAVRTALERLGSINLPAGISSPLLDARDGAASLQNLKGGLGLAFAIDRASRPGLSAGARDLRSRQAETAAVTVKRDLESSARVSRRSTIRRSLREGQKRISWDANLVLTGGQPVRIWTPLGAHRIGRSKSWSVDIGRMPAAQIIIEYADGLFAPVVLYSNLSTLVSHDGKGRISGWMCAPPYETGPAFLSPTNRAIAELQTTRLSPSDANYLATSLRRGKHANPMLGSIAAYLYDYGGDRDNIRRMAWYFASTGQPIPFDIALLGLLPTWREGDLVMADVPPVAARRRRDGREPGFANRETERQTGFVGGLCPWLRQGWDFVALPEPVETPLAAPLQAALPYLLNSSFTALSRRGAEPLIDYFRLEAH